MTRSQGTLTVALAVAVCALASPASALQLRYPNTRKTDVADDYHGTRIADPTAGSRILTAPRPPSE